MDDDLLFGAAVRVGAGAWLTAGEVTMYHLRMRSNEEWIEWGRRAVTIRKGYMELTDDEYYALGVDWYDYAEAWNRAIGYQAGTILEIGCNRGRLTKTLADEFRRVVAIDVSPDMITYGSSRITAQNASWHVGAGDILPINDSVADCAFSSLVFQHFPDNAAQLQLFREIWRSLKPGGTFFIQIPIHIFPGGRFSAVARLAYSAFCLLRHAKTSLAVRIMRFGGPVPMRGVSYEMDRLISDLSKLGFMDVGMTIVRLKRTNLLQSCIYGRKP